MAWLLADRFGGQIYSHPTIPFWNATVRLGFFLIIAAVLSARRRSEQRILELARVKSEFTSMVSHELRTPLTCIKEGIDIVADGSVGPLSERQQKHLDTAKRNVDRLGRLLDDVLDYQKLEGGRMEIVRGACDLGRLVALAVEGFRLPAGKKGLELVMELPPALPQVHCDADRINQVLGNLLHNAVKFTEQGRIRVSAESRAEGVLVCVEDSGPGIAAEDRPKLFESFTQLAPSPGGRRSGTGLGLAIARGIVEHHGGRIGVESEPGRGSTFYFSLPVRAGARAGSTPASSRARRTRERRA